MMVWKMIMTALFAVAVNSGRKKRKLWTKGMKERRSEEAALRMGRNEGKVHGLPLHVSGSSSGVQRDITGRLQSTVDGMQYSSALNLLVYVVFISLFRAQNQPVCLLEAVAIQAQAIWMVLLDQLDKPTTLVD